MVCWLMNNVVEATDKWMRKHCEVTSGHALLMLRVTGRLRCYPLCTMIPKLTRWNTVCVSAPGPSVQWSTFTCISSGRQSGRPGWKTVGVSGGWQGWKVTDPYCRWSVEEEEEEEESILRDHTQRLWRQGWRKQSAHTQRAEKCLR